MSSPIRLAVSRRRPSSGAGSRFRRYRRLLSRGRASSSCWSGLIEDYQVVQLIGMAGAGKTTAVTEVAGLVGRPLAWLTLDDGDVAPGRLLTYLETALASSVTSVERVATSALAAGITHREAAGLLADAVGEAAVLLVLDEIERLADATDALAVLAAIVRYALRSMRIVLSAGRSSRST